MPCRRLAVRAELCSSLPPTAVTCVRTLYLEPLLPVDFTPLRPRFRGTPDNSGRIIQLEAPARILHTRYSFVYSPSPPRAAMARPRRDFESSIGT